MKRVASLSDLDVKNLPAKGFLERFWRWRCRTRAQNELALLLDLDGSDVDCVADLPVLPSVIALHDACATSALLQWQFESRLSSAKRAANSKRRQP